ncbi:MAG: hypothetical protein QOF03_2017 [Alphaproteobacteria bacterium]|jgi:hypothetical protein|nr:hypothetical protein [Alphaproteobacteria bacterium]
MRALRPRTKKLIATLALLVWLPLYAFVAMRVGIAVLPEAGPFLTLVYYALAGTVWILPVGLMLPWMHREPQRR